ncbi:MAG: hypothetical protein Q7S09_04420 [bacterium]|nr:hypothetical protein [bacterium]
MRTFGVGLTVLTIAVLAAWCWIYRGYEKTEQALRVQEQSGSYAGMQKTLASYTAERRSYPLQKLKQFERFANRLSYASGVAAAGLGDGTKAEALFREASRSPENAVACSALYNGAEYLVARNELDAARDQYRKVLECAPYDVAAKINLELLLKRIQERNARQAALKNGKGDPKEGISDYWSRRIPEQNGQSEGSSQRVWR